jgi:hypothetical protein
MQENSPSSGLFYDALNAIVKNKKTWGRLFNWNGTSQNSVADCCTKAHALPHLQQDCSWCSLERKTQTLQGVLYFHIVLRFNISPRPGDECGKHGNSYTLQSKASLSLHQFSRTSQLLNKFFVGLLMYKRLSKWKDKITETGQNVIHPRMWWTVYATSIFAKL